MIIFVISSYYLIKDFLEYKSSNNSNNKLIDDVFIESNIEKDNKEKETIDWNKLLEINEDIIGWIKIENTNINYPILQDNDNLKYLKHSYKGSYNSNGSIFTLNNEPFNDNITTIYGHNMKNGIMFSELSKYMNKIFLDEHSTITIYTKEENNIKLLDFENEIEYYKKASKYSIDNIGEIKKIIKLSTCSYLNNHTTPTDQRYYVIAKLEKVD